MNRWTGILSILIFLAATPVAAGGIGGNVTYAYSDTEVEDTEDFWRDLDTETEVVSFGLVYDTNLAQDRLFNYRIAVNVQKIDQEFDFLGDNIDLDGTGFEINQLLGFGVFRNEHVRVFIGPTLHLGVGFIDEEVRRGSLEVDFEEVLVTFGIGPEIGFNAHLGRHLSLSMTGYARYGFQMQAWDSPFDTPGNASDGDFVGDDLRVGFTTSVFFRFGSDQFKRDGR